VEITFDVTQHEGVPVLAATGEIDVYTAPRLREQLLDLANAGNTTVVVDLTEVSFIDSSGLGVLVSGLKRFREAAGDLLLVVTQPQILKVLDITGHTTVLSIHATTTDALAAR